MIAECEWVCKGGGCLPNSAVGDASIALHAAVSPGPNVPDGPIRACSRRACACPGQLCACIKACRLACVRFQQELLSKKTKDCAAWHDSREAHVNLSARLVGRAGRGGLSYPKYV